MFSYDLSSQKIRNRVCRLLFSHIYKNLRSYNSPNQSFYSCVNPLEPNFSTRHSWDHYIGTNYDNFFSFIVEVSLTCSQQSLHNCSKHVRSFINDVHMLLRIFNPPFAAPQLKECSDIQRMEINSLWQGNVLHPFPSCHPGVSIQKQPLPSLMWASSMQDHLDAGAD